MKYAPVNTNPGSADPAVHIVIIRQNGEIFPYVFTTLADAVRFIIWDLDTSAMIDQGEEWRSSFAPQNVDVDEYVDMILSNEVDDSELEEAWATFLEDHLDTAYYGDPAFWIYPLPIETMQLQEEAA